MNAVSATIQALLDGSGVTAMVGDRVEPIASQQEGELPDIIVQQITNTDEYLVAGPGKYPSARVQLTCRARDKTNVLALGDAVIARLNGLSGTFAGMEVSSFLMEDTDVTAPEEDFKTYVRILDVRVRYRVAAESD